MPWVGIYKEVLECVHAPGIIGVGENTQSITRTHLVGGEFTYIDYTRVENKVLAFDPHQCSFHDRVFVKIV